MISLTNPKVAANFRAFILNFVTTILESEKANFVETICASNTKSLLGQK